MPDTWKVTPALDKAGTGQAIVVPVKALGDAPVTLEQLGARFGLHPDRILAALLSDERNRLAAANTFRTGLITGEPWWRPDLSDDEVAEAIEKARATAVSPTTVEGYPALAEPSFPRWKIPVGATVYVPVHEKLASRVRANGQLSLSQRVVVVDAAVDQLTKLLDDLTFKIDRAARATLAEVDYLRRVRREQGVLTWMDWVAYAMLTESKQNRQGQITDAQVALTREARRRLRDYRRALERHLIEQPHDAVGPFFPKGEGVLGGSASRLVDALAAETTAELIGDIAANPEQVPFALWWRLQSELFRAANVLADAWEPVRRDAYERLVAPALAVVAAGWKENKAAMALLAEKRPAIAAAARDPWPAAKLGGAKPTGAFAQALKNVSSWTTLGKKSHTLTTKTLTLAERWSGEMVARLAADASDRESVAGVFYKLAVGTTEPPKLVHLNLVEALTDPDDERRMRDVVLSGQRMGIGFKTATALMSTTSLVLSLSDDPKVSAANIAAGLSAVVSTGEVIQDVIAYVRKIDDADLFGFQALGKVVGAVGVISSAYSAREVYQKGDITGGHLSTAKTVLAAVGLLVSGPLGAVLVAADLGLTYAQWIREINRGGGSDAYLALLGVLETKTGKDATLTGHLLAVNDVLPEHPADLAAAAERVRRLGFDGGWWDLTEDAGETLLRAHVPGWVVRLAVGSTPWPSGDPTYDQGETVLALDLGQWQKTTVKRAVPQGTEWKYELKLRKATWAEAKLAPYFAKKERVTSLWPPCTAVVREIDLAGGRYELKNESDDNEFEVPFDQARFRLTRA